MEYCAHVISRFSQKVKSRTFDQDDVALFILMERDYCSKGSVLRELGDFLSHPKSRDRGLVFSALESSATLFEEFLQAEMIDPDIPVPRIEFRPLDKGALLCNIEEAFRRTCPETKIDISPVAAEELIACVILLIQYCGVEIKGRRASFELKYGHGLYLKALYNSEKLTSYWAEFPLLSVGNINRSYTGSAWKIDKYVARRIADGRLVAFPFGQDTLRIGQSVEEPDLTEALLLTP